ncbi:MAG: FkbM family methyltransferase [Gammaproteobacteria bacterium]|nr:FkbM family methyltransferase [Gammaproteobacteria bacterium]
MKENCNSELWRKVNSKGFHPNHVAEVGVGYPNTSNVYGYIEMGVKTTLVEPNPDSILLIKEKFDGKNITLHQAAICDYSGEVELCMRQSSTFVADLTSSPALVNDSCNIAASTKKVVKALRFDEVDDGTIELLSIDTEGSEWFVLKNMVSRPAVISVETHGGIYQNPYLEQILDWLQRNRYKLWYKDKSDSVFVLESQIPVTSGERITLLFSNLKIALKSFKKRLSKRIKAEK